MAKERLKTYKNGSRHTIQHTIYAKQYFHGQTLSQHTLSVVYDIDEPFEEEWLPVSLSPRWNPNRKHTDHASAYWY